MQLIKLTDKIYFAARNFIIWIQLQGNYCLHAPESVVCIWVLKYKLWKTEAIVNVKDLQKTDRQL